MYKIDALTLTDGASSVWDTGTLWTSYCPKCKARNQYFHPLFQGSCYILSPFSEHSVNGGPRLCVLLGIIFKAHFLVLTRSHENFQPPCSRARKRAGGPHPTIYQLKLILTKWEFFHCHPMTSGAYPHCRAVPPGIPNNGTSDVDALCPGRLDTGSAAQL